MKSRFPKIVQIAIISVYLIFLAGSIVRMTGSGMGCPDWPKCFGYYIPPTSEEQISWKPNTEFKKGFIIIKDEVLFVAEMMSKLHQNSIKIIGKTIQSMIMLSLINITLGQNI